MAATTGAAAAAPFYNTSVCAVTADTPLQSVAQRLQQMRLTAAIVLSTTGQVAGIITERDLVRTVIDTPRAANGTPLPKVAASIMTPDPMCIRPDASPLGVMELMCSRRFRHVPVVTADHSPLGVADSLTLAGTLLGKQVRKGGGAGAHVQQQQ